MKSALLLDVVIRESTAILQLLASKDQALLVRRDTLLILDLLLHVVNRIRGLDFQRNRLARQGLDENLHTTTETEHQVQGALLLNVVVGESTAILELLSSEDETLLVRWDTLLVLDLLLHVVDGVGRFDLESNRLARKGLNEDLHTTTETENKMEGRLLLNVIVAQGATVFKLLAGENETLLIGRNALLVLDLLLDVVDGIGRFHLKGDGLAGESLNEDLHTTAKAEDEVESGLLLDVVVGKGATILQLLAGENQALLVGGNALLVLNLLLDIVDGIRRLDLEGDGLASH